MQNQKAASRQSFFILCSHYTAKMLKTFQFAQKKCIVLHHDDWSAKVELHFHGGGPLHPGVDDHNDYLRLQKSSPLSVERL